ncbi:hypothetical protein Zmor_007112 [Zophobas morio]|uniref:PHD-type domain-containing protein n=1 Tax=Zophobas morio TaxID=2755281 RepID=A0AA38MPC3_9CUCU|nr:hypothetical protein Zmor_007112 [Zophobas morio]
MLPICGKCHSAIKTRPSSGYLSCSGTCEKRFHFKCVDVPESLQEQLESVPGLNWKCSDCLKKCVSFDSDSLNVFLGRKFEEMVSNLKEVFSDLKTDLIKNAERQIKDTFIEPEPVTSFSSILKNKTKPAVIIEPKNPEQNFAQTKADIASSIDPANEKIQIAKVKSTKNGGMLVSCLSSDQNLRFKQLAQENLANSYVIRELNGISPRVRIVGFSQKYEEDEWVELADYMKSVNNSIFNVSSSCKIFKFWATKKKRSTYQALLQVDKKSYDRLMAAGGLFIGYDYCIVFDGLDANRCFNCNNFGHSSRVCKEKLSCPKCSSEHELSACVAENLKCINCIRMSIKEGK